MCVCETHGAVLVLQVGAGDLAAPQHHAAPLARVPLAAFVLIVQQLVRGQHKPAGLPVTHQVTLRDRQAPWSDRQAAGDPGREGDWPHGWPDRNQVTLRDRQVMLS